MKTKGLAKVRYLLIWWNIVGLGLGLGLPLIDFGLLDLRKNKLDTGFKAQKNRPRWESRPGWLISNKQACLRKPEAQKE